MASDETLSYEPYSESKARNITNQSVKLISRIDFIELDDAHEEVYIKDDFGIYVMYDCVLQDMQAFENELVKLGSFFLKKSEMLLDPAEQPLPYRDRH